MRIAVIAFCALAGCKNDAMSRKPGVKHTHNEEMSETQRSVQNDQVFPRTNDASKDMPVRDAAKPSKDKKHLSENEEKPKKGKRKVRFEKSDKVDTFEKMKVRTENEAPVVVPKIDSVSSKKAFEFYNSLRIDPSSRSPVSFADCGATWVLIEEQMFSVKGLLATSMDGLEQLQINPDIHTGRDDIGIRFQEWLQSSLLADEIVGVHRGNFVGKDSNCKKYVPLEDFYGATVSTADRDRLTVKQVFQIATRGLEILKALHSVGIVHGAVKKGLVWIPNDVGSMKLRNFFTATFYLDPNTGVHHSVSECVSVKKISTVAECPSTYVDLIAFGHIIHHLIDGQAGSGIVSLFRKEVDELGYSEAFNYDEWINNFSDDA